MATKELKISGRTVSEIYVTEEEMLQRLLDARFNDECQHLEVIDGYYYIITTHRSVEIDRKLIRKDEFHYITYLLGAKEHLELLNKK